MPTPQWFEELTVLADLPPRQLLKQLRDLDETAAARALELRLADPEHGYTFDCGEIAELAETPWYQSGQAVGYVAVAEPVDDLVAIRPAAQIAADAGLVRRRVNIDLTAFRAAKYPGGEAHRVLFHFDAVQQWPDGEEYLHFSTSRRVRQGEPAPDLAQPIFAGLTVGPRGLDLRYAAIKVKQTDQAFVEFLEADVYRSGLRLLSLRQPVTALYSRMAEELTRKIGGSSAPIAKRLLGLDFNPRGTSAPLALGTYLAAQIPEARELRWSWEGWRFHPASGRIVDEAEEAFPYNYLALSVHRYPEPWETVRAPRLHAPRTAEVAAANTAEQRASTASAAFAPVPAGAPADLEIEVGVRPEDGRLRLTYVVTWADETHGMHKLPIRGPLLNRPDQFHADLFEELENLNRGLGDAEEMILAEEVGPRLGKWGQRLYRILFPAELKAAYRKFRNRVTTVQITAAEPWIPWELVKPWDESEEPPIDDDFLGMKFQLTRWLSGGTPPAREIPVQALACLEAGRVAGRKALPHAPAERTLLAELALRRPGVRDASPPQATRQAIGQLLGAGGVGLVHFAGHGDCDPGRAHKAAITLIDGSSFAADQIEGELAARVAKDRPLIFFNACRGGRQGLALTGIDGWAPAWVRVARCGAFLAPQWAVRDELAYEFVRVFYGALDQGLSFGPATQLARWHVRGLDPGNSAALAYAVFAHPHGRLSF